MKRVRCATRNWRLTLFLRNELPAYARAVSQAIVKGAKASNKNIEQLNRATHAMVHLINSALVRLHGSLVTCGRGGTV